jgi:hypothetical protein
MELAVEMKKIDFAQLITILANVGVVIGLVFLALEIRQNTAQMRTQGAYSINQSVETLNQAIYLDAEFADLLHRGEKSFKDLDPVEQNRLATYFFSEVYLAQYILSLEDEGLSDLHFGYVDLKISQFRTVPGRREFVEAYIEPSTFSGREDIQRMLTEE